MQKRVAVKSSNNEGYNRYIYVQKMSHITMTNIVYCVYVYRYASAHAKLKACVQINLDLNMICETNMSHTSSNSMKHPHAQALELSQTQQGCNVFPYQASKDIFIQGPVQFF